MTIAAPTDIEQIAHLVQEVEAGVNTKDPARAVAPFTDDGVAVSVLGVVATGRDDLLEAHRAAFADGPLAVQGAHYELGEVRFLGDDVAIALKQAWRADADGTPVEDDPAMVALYVFTRTAGGWRVAARQNTLIGT